MIITNTALSGEVDTDRAVTVGGPAASTSAVSWGAILAGAAAAAALSLILLILGVGLGLSSVSPWAQSGVSAGAFGIGTIVWITFTQLAASGMGGYLAGRLRTRWTAVHTDEVYFRDTAHGFLAWAIASLVTAAVLGSAVGAIVSAGAQAGATVAGGAATAATVAAGSAAAASGQREGGMDPSRYFVDSLFRRDMGASATASLAAGATGTSAPVAAATPVPTGTPDGSNGASAGEVTRIFLQSMNSGNLPPEDVRYVGQIVAQRTGISQADAGKRVTDAYGRMQAKANEAATAAKDAADKARKASSYAALWLFVSLLIGAFIASLAATFGGRQRDLI